MDNKQDKGFTLVELLIVIVILGILATVTVFAVRGITQNAQDNACDVEQRTIETAIEAYYADTGNPPADSATAAPYGGWAVLTPTYVKEDAAVISQDWSFTGGSATVEAAVTPIVGGKCA
jgi:prepilin-type N-terminal cleavage/methylation domain-containing protein